MEEVDHKNPNNSNLAIFWDVENVRPTFFAIDDLLSNLSKIGVIGIKRAFADWKLISQSVAEEIGLHEFQMFHQPHSKNFKNSSDILFSVNLLDTTYQFQDISTYVLITKDSDFRYVVKNLHDKNKQVILVCDPPHTSSILLDMVDTIIDYTSLTEVEEEGIPVSRDDITVEKKSNLFYEKLIEAIQRECEIEETTEVLHSRVLTRIKLIYENLDDDLDEILLYNKLTRTRWFGKIMDIAEENKLIVKRRVANVYYISVREDNIPSKQDDYLEFVRKYLQNKGLVTLTELALELSQTYGAGYFKTELGYLRLPICMNVGVNKGQFNMELDKETNIYVLWVD